MIITSGVFQVSRNIRYVTLSIAFSRLSKYVLFRFTEKVLFIIVEGCFPKRIHKFTVP